MGTRSRPKPKRLAEKLLQIRLSLGLSQNELLYRLEAEDSIDYTKISRFESGTREPPLMILLRYARVAGVHMEALVDDEIDLPDKLPGSVAYGSIKRQYPARPAAKKRRPKS
jgi:transcriptional regulator with XRE-family HTH domain